MSEYLIVRCTGCDITWAMDFQACPCTCDPTEDPPLCDFWQIEADSYHQATHKAVMNQGEPT